jgi:uncharacterized membrane protein YoaK (UPF0700 family)
MSTPTETSSRAAEPSSVADRSLGDLISEVTQDLSTLLRQEVELAKAEVQQSAKRAGKGAGMLSGAAVAGYFVVLFASLALWWAIVGAILALVGRKELRAVRGLPRTASTVQKIPDALKGNEGQA